MLPCGHELSAVQRAASVASASTVKHKPYRRRGGAAPRTQAIVDPDRRSSSVGRNHAQPWSTRLAPAPEHREESVHAHEGSSPIEPRSAPAVPGWDCRGSRSRPSNGSTLRAPLEYTMLQPPRQGTAARFFRNPDLDLVVG